MLLVMTVLNNYCLACICHTSSVAEYLSQNDSVPKNQEVLIFKGVVFSIDDSLIVNKFGYGQVVQLEVLEYWPDNSLEFLKTPHISIFNDGSKYKANL